MKTTTKLILSFIFGAMFTLVIHNYILQCFQATDLEVYTPMNIYYINGLTVTNEVDESVMIFKDKYDLKLWLSDITAWDVNNHKSEE